MRMRWLGLLVVVQPLACAARPPPADVATRKILAIERAWDDAEVRHDVAALGAMMDDRFVITFGSEAPVGKATVLQAIRENTESSSSSTPSEQRVIVDGDVAVATGVDSNDRVVGGKTVTTSYRHTTTFIHRDGRWRARSVHIVVLPTGGGRYRDTEK